MIVCIDNGHGSNTSGKRSPDGTFREYAWTRKLAKALKEELTKLGIEVLLVTPEDLDVSINTRVQRVNTYKYQDKNKICISLHNNAAGNGSLYTTASGFSVHVAQNASTNSRKLANCLFESAEKLNIKVRPYSVSQPYWIQNLGICRDTKCPAVLTESMFMDNKEDVKFLNSEEGFKTMLNIHVNGIKKYFNL